MVTNDKMYNIVLELIDFFFVLMKTIESHTNYIDRITIILGDLTRNQTDFITIFEELDNESKKLKEQINKNNFLNKNINQVLQLAFEIEKHDKMKKNLN